MRLAICRNPFIRIVEQGKQIVMRLPRQHQSLSVKHRLFTAITSVVVAILQHASGMLNMCRHFVYRQIGPNLWTATVLPQQC